MTKKKRKRAEPGPIKNAEVRAKVVDWLKKHDRQLYINGNSLKFARLKCLRDLGLPTKLGTAEYRAHSVTAMAFRFHVDGVCRMFKQLRRKKISEAAALADRGWERLKRAVRDLEELLIECDSIDDAVQIVRSKCSCNRRLLAGLPIRQRVWEKGSTPPR